MIADDFESRHARIVEPLRGTRSGPASRILRITDFNRISSLITRILDAEIFSRMTRIDADDRG